MVPLFGCRKYTEVLETYSATFSVPLEYRQLFFPSVWGSQCILQLGTQINGQTFSFWKQSGSGSASLLSRPCMAVLSMMKGLSFLFRNRDKKEILETCVQWNIISFCMESFCDVSFLHASAEDLLLLVMLKTHLALNSTEVELRVWDEVQVDTQSCALFVQHFPFHLSQAQNQVPCCDIECFFFFFFLLLAVHLLKKGSGSHFPNFL